MSSTSRKPLWLYPNLLSLDAPLVAVGWLYVFLSTWRLYHPWEAYVALFLAVWGIYVADRLLDYTLLGQAQTKIEPRHDFHFRYRGRFVRGVVLALVVALVLVLTRMPVAIYKHLFWGVGLLAAFFGFTMVTIHERQDVPLTKNIIAGVAFAFGVSMTAHLYRFEFGLFDLLGSKEFVCFAVLCILNISAIDLWEHAAKSTDQEVKASDEWSLTMPVLLLGAVSLGYAVMDQEQSARPFFYAILTASGLMYVLNRIRNEFSMDALRVLADLALLIPVLVYDLISRGV